MKYYLFINYFQINYVNVLIINKYNVLIKRVKLFKSVNIFRVVVIVKTFKLQ